MGVIYSIPLCAKGEAAKDVPDANAPAQAADGVAAAVAPVDANNNSATVENLNNQVIRQQPRQLSATSLANPNATVEEPPPRATSTPRADREVSTVDEEDLDRSRKYSSSADDASSEGGRHGDNSNTSDSGLEQSSSDELELGAAALGRKAAAPAGVAAALQGSSMERPFSAAGRPKEDEGFEASKEQPPPLDVIALDNHDTCEDDFDEDDEVEEPLERPPEPAVPDERVDSSSNASSNRSSPEKKTRSSTEAITELLSEMVGQEDETFSKANREGPSFSGAIESERGITR